VGEAIAELERAQRIFLKNRGAADHDESVEIGRKGGGNETPMNNRITKRSIVIAGRKTSVSLEEPFWVSAKEIAALEEITVIKLVEQIHNRGGHSNLSSAIRLFVLDHYKTLATNAANKEISPRRF
jgi:predicted DNA-binding ribbon-helix-helix protein